MRDDAGAALARIKPARVAAHVAYLSSDLLRGRAPGTPGARRAAEYIADSFAHAGLEPLDGSYFHDVPLRGWVTDSVGTRIVTGRSLRGVRLERADFVLWSPGARGNTTIEGTVIYGSGVLDTDLTEHILVLGDVSADRAQRTAQLAAAARAGARAVLMIHDDARAGYDWEVVRASWGGEVLTLANDTTTMPAVAGWITARAARTLLARPNAHARIELRGQARAFNGTNVMAVKRGRGPEWVVHLAHYDHLGQRASADGDALFNGAYDNASGVAVLLEVAHAFGGLRTTSERSVLFLATTAEEAGQLGARWFVQNPPVPLAQIAAAINIDGANLWGETEDIGAIGVDRSYLGGLLERAAARERMRTIAERAPEQHYLYRSDLGPFIEAGIPGLSIEHGLGYTGRSATWGITMLDDYLRNNYHRASDEYRVTFDFAGAVQQARVIARLLLLAASSTSR